MISSFRGEYYFLSNFYDASVIYEGIMYKNSEAAFQAQKTLDINERMKFANLSPSDAKKLGRRVTLRADWDDVKYLIMQNIVDAKFNQHPMLAKSLIATENEHLEEGNTWGDKIWGTVNGVGSNWLGMILMNTRERLKKELSRG